MSPPQILTHQELPDFIEKVDAAGGPAAADFWDRWGSIRYQPSISIDPALDPFGPQYFERMLDIYREISGREFDQTANELTDFDFANHAEAFTSYGGHTAPADIALHFHRLSSAVRAAKLPRGASFLDMGCGWGFSTELLAQCGFKVTAVDINPAFVSLVETRCRRLGYPVKTVLSSFDDFQTDETFDGILFYECFHHAARPWDLVRKLAGNLRDGGQILLAGEPIQDEFWPHWGLRRDPLSIYCIRKFGWFESGWSLAFLKEMFARAGLVTHVKQDTEGLIVWAARPQSILTAGDLTNFIDPGEWHVSPTHLISKGVGTIDLTPPAWATAIEFQIANYRGKPIDFHLENRRRILANKTLDQRTLAPGDNLVRIPVPAGLSAVTLRGSTWLPSKELGTDDTRQMSFHLAQVRFIP